MKKIFLLVVLAVLTNGCSILKKNKSPKENTLMFDTFLARIEKNKFNKAYLTEKWVVQYQASGKSVSFNARVSLIKDSLIYLSVSKFGFPVAKALITPQKASYYETIGKTYYEGTLTEIARQVGLSFDFYQLQAVITGDVPLEIRAGQWDFMPTGRNEAPYKLVPDGDSFVKQLYLNRFFKVFSQKWMHNDLSADIRYEKYFEDTVLPENIVVETHDTRIEIKVKKVMLNKAPEFKYRIPGGYRKLRL